MTAGQLLVTVTIEVPPPAVDRVKAMSRRWVKQTVTIAKFEEVEATDAEKIVKKIRAKNDGMDIRGQWTGSMNIGG